MDAHADSEPWFGLEQEYMLFDPETEKPYGWPRHGFPEAQVSHLYMSTWICLPIRAPID